MRTDLLVRASRDTGISLRARGVLAVLVAVGEVLPADSLWKMGLAGRDSIRHAYRELKDCGYICSDRVYKSGQWVTVQRFPDA